MPIPKKNINGLPKLSKKKIPKLPPLNINPTNSNDNEDKKPNSNDVSDEQSKNYEESENDFTKLSDKEIHNEDAADKLEEETTNDFTGEDVEENDETPPKQIIPDEVRQNIEEEKKKKSIEKSDDPFMAGTDTQAEPDGKYIDKKKHKIIPFGGNKSKPRKERSKKFRGESRFDDRKDQGKFIKTIRLVVMAGIVVIFLFGIKNTFFQSIPNQNEIAAIAKEANGDTGYPTQKGQALAEQFTEAYLSFDSNNSNDRTLSYFYNGSEKTSTIPDVPNRSFQGIVKQKVLVTPKTFDTVVGNSYSATFYVSTLVSDLKEQASDSDGDQTSRWVALAVNVLYDKKHNQLQIAKDSPELIPSFKVSSGQAFSSTGEEPLGTGTADDNALSDMKSTIIGYLTAYADSTTTNHSKLDQYVENNPDPSVIDGFNGKFKFSGDSSNFSASAYPVSSGKDNSQWKVDLKIAWQDADSTKTNGISYSGRYIMTISKKGGKYFVEKFVPYTYVKNSNN